MVDRPTALPGTLMLHTLTNEAEMNIALDIPVQTIYLRGFRIELGSAANALTEKVLYLDIPGIFNINKMLDDNRGLVYLPIFLDNAAVTHTYGMDIPISMIRHLPERFTIRILNGSFQPVANLVSASFQFSTEFGHSS